MSRPKRGQPTQIQEAMTRVARADPDACVEWIGTMTGTGYGQAWFEGRKYKAHRLVYALAVAPIPEGLTVDHICFNTVCINPAHLRLLTLSQNRKLQRRAFKTHCIHGHEFTRENTIIRRNGTRQCRACTRLTDRRCAKRPRAAETAD